MEYSSIFVCLMGMGTVFFGLICLIALTYLMSAVVGRGKKAAPAPVPAAPQTAGEVTPELVAAVSAALAEELGTDITGIRIVSMKKGEDHLPHRSDHLRGAAGSLCRPPHCLPHAGQPL